MKMTASVRWMLSTFLGLLASLLIAAGAFIGFQSTFDPDERITVIALFVLGATLLITTVFAFKRVFLFRWLSSHPNHATGLVAIATIIITFGIAVAHGNHRDAIVRERFPNLDLRTAWKLYRISEFQWPLGELADQAGAIAILEQSGLQPAQPMGRDRVDAEIFGDYWVSLWCGTYGKSDTFGVRHGRGRASYSGSNDTYFEVP